MLPTMMDLVRKLDGKGKIAAVAEVLEETNEILEDLVTVECNQGTGHKTVIRTGLPESTWRKLNYGVQPSKSTSKPVTDACGMLEAYADIDASIVNINNNKAEFRFDEDKTFIESMNQKMAASLFYGDTATNPERFVGLSPRFDLKSAENGGQIVDAAGETTLTSVWLVVWAPNLTHTIYPAGSKVGLSIEDKGQVSLYDAAGGKYEGYSTHYKWDIGLAVRDWRYVVRIANINTANLISGTGAADLVKLMVQADESIPNLKAGRAAWYGNKIVRTALRNQINAKVGNNLTWDTVAGKRVLAFDEIPFRRCDQIISTETKIV